MQKQKKIFHLFDVVGVELEYMIVDNYTFNVKPISDHILKARDGQVKSVINNGSVTWSNEIVKHVIELKTTNPVAALDGLADEFHRNICQINNHLETYGAMLLSSAVHPFMDPGHETVIWDHDDASIYNLYDQIFNCKGHGWSNLQSMHLNLPFNGDEEFGRLHAAIRLLLPILPGLCASSPVLDATKSGYLDTRLEVYKHNQERVYSIAGDIIPEPAFTKEEYENLIFSRITKDIEPFDPHKILDKYFLNSRGCIARFDRNAIEIRVLDMQESPAADIAIAQFIVEVLKLFVNEQICTWSFQKNMVTSRLVTIFNETIKYAEGALVHDKDFLIAFGIHENSATCTQIWKVLFDRVRLNLSNNNTEIIESIISKGSLASRILRCLDDDYSNDSIVKTYKSIGDCLKSNQLFLNSNIQ